jgi:hypothetical protein
VHVRRRALRGERTARLGRVLPLHALPAADGLGGGRLGTDRAGLADRHPGEELIQAYDPGDGGFHKLFCSACGSALWSRHPEASDVISIRLGAFDSDPGIRPSYHQFVAYAAPWEPLPDDGLPRYPERRPTTD